MVVTSTHHQQQRLIVHYGGRLKRVCKHTHLGDKLFVFVCAPVNAHTHTHIIRTN